MTALIAVLLAAILLTTVLRSLPRWKRLRSGDLGSSAERATFATLHTAGLAAPALREGLTVAGAERAVRHLRTLLDASAVALTDDVRTLAVEGSSHHHAEQAIVHGQGVLRTGGTEVLSAQDVSCGEADCPARVAVASPLTEGGAVVGALVAYRRESSALLVRAVQEVAGWVSGQLELAAAERGRTRMVEAELRALRAQISPHFVYNSLTAIASFTRTDPDRARELLLEFADFTRYALRSGTEFTTLAEELRNTERYLVLEQARFGDRLAVSLRAAPEVLPVSVPFLVIQPLVENAVRHGLEGRTGTVRVSLTAADDGPDALITVEDDGAGSDPELIRAALLSAGAGTPAGPTTPAGPATGQAEQGRTSVGLGNVDARLRKLYGDEYGLVVETAPGAGTMVRVRIPKFAPGVGWDQTVPGWDQPVPD